MKFFSQNQKKELSMNVLKKFMIILFLININNFHASAAEMNFAV
jgi:hypothetical protein